MTKSLKKLFQEAHLTLWERQSLPVLADAEGVVWVAGFGCAERVQAGGRTRRVLSIAVTEESRT